jgi:O-antigen ligase
MGWGIGSYKFDFFPLSGLHTRPWTQAHNDFLQILFETGYIGLSVILIIIGTLFYKLRNNKVILIGLSLVCIDMMIHFPIRVLNIVLILICFLAYCETKIKEA